MTEQLNISKDLHKQYFWDVNLTDFDVDRSKRLIIERVFALGITISYICCLFN